MSALAWLFGLGFLALAGPLLFHLIRRTPQGQVPFSSLMFLRPTPPRLTRRSRLDNLLLLALRMAAVALIAAAFMRPFFNSNIKLDLAELPGRKTAVLIDTSASMKRADLWAQAGEKLQQVIAAAEPNDEIAVFTFDSQLEKQLDFTKPSDAEKLPQQFRELKLQPSWNASQLGQALVEIASRLLESQRSELGGEPENNDGVVPPAAKLQVVVISDMQAGSSNSALQSFRWPEEIKVQFEQVSARSQTNATLELLPIDDSDPLQNRENVLVRNSKDSTSDQFSVAWENSSAAPTPFQVPPGLSKILSVARDATSQRSNKLVLGGDDADFDNTYFAIAPVPQTVSIAYFGDDSPNDPEEMLYYFKRSLIETSTTNFDVQQYAAAAVAPGDADQKDFELKSVDFVVVTRAVSVGEREAIDGLLESGVTLLIVLSDQTILDSTPSWTGVIELEEATDKRIDQYAMLGNIDFSHPVFSPFSGPRFNDFTEIRFWEFLRPSLSDNVQVLARFDDDTPAFWHQISNDKSEIYVLGCGWQPSKSQLALSSKFLPLMMRMIELATKTEPVAVSKIVGEKVVPPQDYDRLISPDGSVEILEDASAVTLDVPGIYSFANSSDSSLDELQFAANIDPAESQTDVMPFEQMSALGVELGTHNTNDEEVEQQRQLRDFELENRQKIWKWLVLGAIGLIVAESWLAGRTDRTVRRNETVEQGTANE